MTRRPSPPRIAAVLVVRDESALLPGCLASLAGVVDQVIVHDTGSVDDTVALARSAGAVVHQGYWDDDFGRARNVGLELADAEWVLVVDADERVRADPAGLRALLAATRADVLVVEVENVRPEELGGSYRHPGPRLLRRDVVRYTGRVHEQPRRVAPGPTRTASCPAGVLEVTHLGYADADLVRRKAERNAAVARDELDRLLAVGDADPVAVAKAHLDLGRSLLVGDRRQLAVDAFEQVRALAPGTRWALEATDALALLLLGEGLDDVVLVLAEQLRAGGTDPRYCDWLRAQALAQLGRPHQALALLRGVDALVDSAGRRLDVGPVLEVRALVASLCGLPDEAVGCLAGAMVTHGRIRGRGGLLLDLHGARPVADLLDLLAAVPDDRRAELVAELAGCRAPGPELAARLGPVAVR